MKLLFSIAVGVLLFAESECEKHLFVDIRDTILSQVVTILQVKLAHKGTSDSSMAITCMKVEWSYAIIISGAQSVMMHLAGQIVLWFVDSLDLAMQVYSICNLFLFYFKMSIFYALGASTPTRAHFGQGTGPIWLDDVACTGTEARLIDCSSRPIGTHNCGHNEDVGTRCIPIFSKFLQISHHVTPPVVKPTG